MYYNKIFRGMIRLIGALLLTGMLTFLNSSVLSLFGALFILVASSARSFPSSDFTNRAKRFVAGFSPFGGGNFGCVVSADRLYINGRFTKNLSEAEQDEMHTYARTLTAFKESVKSFIEQQQQPSSTDAKKQFQQPEPPKRPSFCSEKSTTQYVFDGCTVQGDSVYIGETFVRKLDTSEQTKLQKFEQQLAEYQEEVAKGLKKQMEKFLGRQFLPFFASNSSSTASEAEQSVPLDKVPIVAENERGVKEEDEGEKKIVAVAPPSQPAPKQPTTPNFCTLIV